MGMELLILMFLVPAFMTKVVQNGRTDREYAKQGQVSPRHQVRLARLEKAGRPTSPKTRGPLRNYLSELYADAVLDLADKHRSKREHRGPVVYDPDKPSLTQRFDSAVLGGIERVKQHRGWDVAKAAGRALVDPVGERKPEPDRVSEAAPDPVPPVDTPVADREAKAADNAAAYGRIRVGYVAPQVGDVLFGRCGHRAGPAEFADAAGSECPNSTALNSIYCPLHTPRPQVEPAGREPEPNQTAPTGGTMTAPTGEAVNYETTVAELEALAREQRGHLDHCQAALKSINDAKGSINNMQESYRASAAAASLTAEHLAAKNLDGVTLANAGTTADAMPAGVVDQMYDQLEAMEVQAQARFTDAEVALGSTEANLSHIQSEYGDAHAKVAGNLSGDASFLDSAGGTPVGGRREPIGA